MTINGFLNVEHAIYVVHKARTWSTVLVVGTGENVTRIEAPLDRDRGAMIQKICRATVAKRDDCTVLGTDGTWFYLETSTPSGKPTWAVTWDPKHGTPSDAVVDVFTALRAYVGAASSVRTAAYSTLIDKTRAAYDLLGLPQRGEESP